MSHSLEHILFMKLKDLNESEFKELTDKIEELKTLPGVLIISFGKNLCVDRSGGYNYGYRVLFEDPKDLDTYGPHPTHEEFKVILNKYRVDPPIVSDYLIPRVNKENCK
ncbi:hypothetical protein CYY_005843 [Polysphondylium violaceum]|uniref:Stress-response A/B barrel domain-containing protein n=1 Tax=Polysphondylium violaceum TaxID=133409 RepID=A0A8J4PSU7_9MYCE|nr:hypothetical protein CYY_005843 [Polysphondylium violaceum]